MRPWAERSAIQGSRAASIGLALALLIAAASPACAQVVPIRATYAFSLAWAAPGSPIAAVAGAYDVDLTQTCDGWSYVNNTVQRLTLRDGRGSVATYEVGGIESSDGRRLAFRVRAAPPDAAVIAYRGLAELGDAGSGRLQVDGAPAVDLPPETLFPSRLAVALLEQAAAGTAAAEYAILSAAFDRPWRVRLEVDPATNAELPHGQAIDARLLAGRSWRIRARSVPASEAPGYTLTSWTFANGVVAEYLYDYGTFAVRARLERLAAKQRPSC